MYLDFLIVKLDDLEPVFPSIVNILGTWCSCLIFKILLFKNPFHPYLTISIILYYTFLLCSINTIMKNSLKWEYVKPLL